jgi:hypothetical protein
MINAAKILIVAVGVVASLAVLLLMRYPQLRREQYRTHAPFSLPTSLLCAGAVLGLLALMAYLQ